MRHQGVRIGWARIVPEKVEALSGPLSWFSPRSCSSDMGTIESLEREMPQLEIINLHM